MSKTQHRLTEANLAWLQNFTGEPKVNDAITFLRGRYSKAITISNDEGVKEECVTTQNNLTIGGDHTPEPISTESVKSQTTETKTIQE